MNEEDSMDRTVAVVLSGCPSGYYGVACQERCRCDNDAACDHVSGSCTCNAGWMGRHCTQRSLSLSLSLSLFYSSSATLS